MRLFDELKRAHSLLAPYQNQWAICGGVAASIYRDSPRFTDDIDFAVIDGDELSAKELAQKVIKAMGYKEYIGVIPDPEQDGRSITGLLCARTEDNKRFIGLDFLLPTQGWVQSAVNLAQENKIDYGFATVSTVTQESLIFSKLIAVNGNPERYQDMDDISQILASNKVNKEWIQQEVNTSKVRFRPEVLSLVFKS